MVILQKSLCCHSCHGPLYMAARHLCCCNLSTTAVAIGHVDEKTTCWLCLQSPPPPPPEPYGCTALGLGPNSLSCLDLSLLLLYILFLAGLVWAAVHWRVFAHTFSHSQVDDTAADSFPLLESEEADVDGLMAEDIDGDEKAYSPVEQWLRPVFYKLVRATIAFCLVLLHPAACGMYRCECALLHRQHVCKSMCVHL